jgi:hypothetical protein
MRGRSCNNLRMRR